jgi:hypothetical protein
MICDNGLFIIPMLGLRWIFSVATDIFDIRDVSEVGSIPVFKSTTNVTYKIGFVSMYVSL